MRKFLFFILLASFKLTNSQIITTIAGNGIPGYNGDGGIAYNASLNSPTSGIIDKLGNLFFIDYGNHVIRKINLNTNIITTVAGNGTTGFTGDGGPATAAALALFLGGTLGLDTAGNLYIADQSNHRIRKVTKSTGIITTIAGNGTMGFSGDGGLATSANLSNPASVVVEASGDIYISDLDNNRIRKISASTGIINTYVGTGATGYAGDGGAALTATITKPMGLTLDPSENLFISEYGNHVIRKVTKSTGIISTAAGNGIQGFGGDGGSAISAKLSNPEMSVVFDPSGNMFIPDLSNYRIRKVNSSGVIATFAGNGINGYSGDGGLATLANISVWGVAIDKDGNLYISGSDHIRKVINCNLPGISQQPSNANAMAGFNAVFAIQACQATSFQWQVKLGTNFTNVINSTVYTGANSPSLKIFNASTSMNGLTYRCLAQSSSSDTSNIATLIVSPFLAGAPVITSVAGNGLTGIPTGDGAAASSATLGTAINQIAVDKKGNIYIPIQAWHRIRKVDVTTGIITTIGGTGNVAYSGDGGPAISAGITSPTGLVFDTTGNLFVLTQGRIRKIDTTGIITTIAGDGSNLSSGDGGLAINAQINCINYNTIAIDRLGNLYIGEGNTTSGCVIRKITSSTGIITTIAGMPGLGGYSGDGGPATSAQLKKPYYLAVDSAGNVFISDQGNSAIRKITKSTGIITTIAGGINGYSGDGGPAINAKLGATAGLVFDKDENLYISDLGNSCIRKISKSTGIITRVAGMGTNPGIDGVGDGGSALDAILVGPYGLVFNPKGKLLVADGSRRVRQLDTCNPAANFVLYKDVVPYTWDAYATYAPLVTTAKWYWGDGTSTPGLYPSHTYSAAGNYNISLTVYSACGDSAASSQTYSIYKVMNTKSMIYVNVKNGLVGIQQIDAKALDQLVIYPNPSSQNINVHSEKDLEEIKIFNSLGSLIYESRTTDNSLQIDISKYQSGIYFIQVQGRYKKFVKE